MFTENQIKEIYEKLARFQGIKNSEFPVADHIEDDDIVVIVQNGVNRQISIEQLKKELGTVTPTPVDDGKYQLTINCNVEDAVITVNNTKITGNTTRVEKNTWANIMVTKDGYTGYGELVRMDGDRTVYVKLQPMPVDVYHMISVNTEPYDAVVTINGEERNSYEAKDGEEVTVTITAPGYKTYTETFIATDDRDFEIKLDKNYKLEVKSNFLPNVKNISGTATIYDDTEAIKAVVWTRDDDMNPTPNNGVMVSCEIGKTYRIKLECDGYKTEEFDYTAIESDFTYVNDEPSYYGYKIPTEKLVKISGGKVVFNVVPSDSTIEVSGVDLTKINDNTWTSTGDQIIEYKVSHKGYTPSKGNVALTDGRENTISVTLDVMTSTVKNIRVVNTGEDDTVSYSGVPSTGGTVSVKVIADVEYSDGTVEKNVELKAVYSDPDDSATWVHHSINGKYIVDANDSNNTRNTTIAITLQDYDGGISFMIDQGITEAYIDVSRTSLEFTYEGGTEEIEVRSNQNWTIS